MPHVVASRGAPILMALFLPGLAACRYAGPPAMDVEVREVSPGAYEILTEHFDLRVTAKDATLREMLPRFVETAMLNYQTLMPPAREPGERLVVYVFDNRQQWQDFTVATFPDQAYTYLHIQAGGYTDEPTATAVAFDLHGDHTLSLLGHEGQHQYLARYFPERVVSWLGEGLACQWEAFDLKHEQPYFTPRRNFIRRNNLREALVTENGLIPLPDLLRMNAGDAVRNAIQPTRTYYAQVWSLVLFLRDPASGAYTLGFKKLLADAGTERFSTAVRAYRAATPEAATMSDGEVAFRQYITEDFDCFLKEYRGYVQAVLDLIPTSAPAVEEVALE